jgi:hypothetical protein
MELRASIERKRSLWLSAQEGCIEAQIQLGVEWLGQEGQGDEIDDIDLGLKCAGIRGCDHASVNDGL